MVQFFTIPISVLVFILSVYKGHHKLHAEASTLAFTASIIALAGLAIDQVLKGIYGHYVYFF